MATTTTSSVYIHVIEDVISKVREEFIGNGGPDESVLNELQGIWEMKMMQAGVLLGPIERNSGQRQPIPGGPTPVHDLNVPYEQTEEYETPTAEILFPPTPLQTPAPTPLTGSVDNSGYNIPTGTSDYPTPASDGGGNSDIKGVRPSPYMQPPSPWPNARTPLGVDVNVAYVEGREEGDRAAARQATQPPPQDFLMMSAGKRKREEFPSRFQNGGYIPQQDGAGDAVSNTSMPLMNHGGPSTSRHDFWCTSKETVAEMGKTVSKIPQADGPIPDPYEDMLSTPNIYNYQVPVQEDYNLVNTPAPELQAPTPVTAAQIDALEDDEDEPLNENDDDDDVDDVDQGDELNTQHLVLAQFDKVTRTKSRWKCTLKDGIMHINNKDILFNKATGEFEF